MRRKEEIASSPPRPPPTDRVLSLGRLEYPEVLLQSRDAQKNGGREEGGRDVLDNISLIHGAKFTAIPLQVGLQVDKNQATKKFCTPTGKRSTL